MEPIVNKVAESGLITLDPVQFLPDPESIKTFDLKNYLFRELILKEKDFRAALKETDWSVYDQKHVAVFCSVDAIIPAWAYMLIASYLPKAATIFFGSEQQLLDTIIAENIKQFEINPYKDQRIVIKTHTNYNMLNVYNCYNVYNYHFEDHRRFPRLRRGHTRRSWIQCPS